MIPAPFVRVAAAIYVEVGSLAFRTVVKKLFTRRKRRATE